MALVETNLTQSPPNSDDDPNRDLGFGAVVARDSRKRLLNRDGSFNVAREGLSFLQSLSPYQFLLTTSWPHFLGRWLSSPAAPARSWAPRPRP